MLRVQLPKTRLSLIAVNPSGGPTQVYHEGCQGRGRDNQFLQYQCGKYVGDTVMDMNMSMLRLETRD